MAGRDIAAALLPAALLPAARYGKLPLVEFSHFLLAPSSSFARCRRRRCPNDHAAGWLV
jgi:hypothetical protein